MRCWTGPLFVACALAASAAEAASAADELLNADRALAAESKVHGFVAAYSKAMAADARKLDAGAQPAIGPEAIAALMSRYPKDLSVEWTPAEAVVARSGELGFTWGRYIARYHDTSGILHTEHGKYLDIWRRQPDGSWRWIADMGNTNDAPSNS